MSFEHQLRPAFDSLTARLRGDLERHLETAAQELAEHAQKAAQTAAEERESLLADAVERAKAEARDEIERSARERHEAQLSDMEARHRAEIDSARNQHRDELDVARSQHRERVSQIEREQQEALERRIDALSTEHRATIERTLQEQDARVERTVAEVERRVMSSLQAADLAAGARLAEAFRAIDAAASLSDILNALSEAVSNEASRSALFLAGTASVKSWKTHGFSVNGGGAIEVAAADAGIIQVALDTREPASTAGDGGDDAGVCAPAFAGLSDDRPAIAVPMIVNGEVVTVVYADQGQGGEIDRASWPSVVEVLARHASRALESITAHRLAQTLGSGATRPRAVAKPADVIPVKMQPETTSGEGRLKTAPTSPQPAASKGADEDPNAAAQLVARTLITAIRAEHGEQVQAGLRERDLMTRLGGPIARAWAEYEAKVPEAIRSATNFFHAEMVRTLADGDASLLTPKS